MANEEHLSILKQGVDVWNQWRSENREIVPDLSGAKLNGIDLTLANLSEADFTEANMRNADLHRVDFSKAKLIGADLAGANLSEANLHEADLRGANLSKANLNQANIHMADLRKTTLRGTHLFNTSLHSASLGEADLEGADLLSKNLSESDLNGAKLIRADLRLSVLDKANLVGADLSEANLTKASLIEADLSGADLTRASLVRADLSVANLRGANLSQVDLTGTMLVETDLSEADISGCRVFGVSAWNVNLESTQQNNLIITKEDEAVITVDNLEVAQFVYLLLHNEKIRNVIDTITSKAVLILGRFKPERKVILDAIRNDLRKKGYLPILFDFEKPSSRDLTETVRTLAHLAYFVIADLTEPSSIPHELTNIVPFLPSVPVKPIILSGNKEYAMIESLYRYDWMLPAHEYESQDTLIAELSDKVIKPAQDKAEERKPK